MAKNPKYQQNNQSKPDTKLVTDNEPTDNVTDGTVDTTKPDETSGSDATTDTGSAGDNESTTSPDKPTDTEPTPPEAPTDSSETDNGSETPTDPSDNNDSSGDGNPTTPNPLDDDLVGNQPAEQPKTNIEIATDMVSRKLNEYGLLMNKRVRYSRVEGPKNQLLIITLFEDIFVNTLDYDIMRAKIEFLFKYVKNLSKTDHDFLKDELPYRGLDYVDLPASRRENYSRLMNMVQRLALSNNRNETLKYLSLDFTFEHHPRSKTLEYAKNIITDICS